MTWKTPFESSTIQNSRTIMTVPTSESNQPRAAGGTCQINPIFRTFLPWIIIVSPCYFLLTLAASLLSSLTHLLLICRINFVAIPKISFHLTLLIIIPFHFPTDNPLLFFSRNLSSFLPSLSHICITPFSSFFSLIEIAEIARMEGVPSERMIPVPDLGPGLDHLTEMTDTG